jgi:hypothetical protein
MIGHEQIADDAFAANFRASLSARADEVEKFELALQTISRFPDWNCISGSLAALQGIKTESGQGNSFEDLHLSLYGFKFGKLIRESEITSRADAADWIRADLGGGILDA